METDMIKRALLTTALIGGLAFATPTIAQEMDPVSQATFDTAMAFMGAMGEGDMEKMVSLMDDEMVWLNGGDKTVPWIGPWKGQEEILAFLQTFSANWQTTKWENEDVFARGDTLAVFGQMNGKMTKSGADIGEFTFGLRVKVKDGKIVLWNWLEDSFAVSKAYHGG
jgi:ketosteroid isomerase-like protein